MSFTGSKKLMEEGDIVLIYLGFDNFASIKLIHGHVHQNRYGAIKHDRLIGAPYGVKVDCPKGWVYPLQPTPELWTLALPHRTQILYTPDISMVVLQLDLKPGSVVVEAGTGSGSLSHALIRSVMPTGRLHTFEFHAERCAAAAKEFEEHGLADYVTAKHRDVCAAGFELSHEADAVFLDLPAPWECIGHAKQALKTGGRICSFSPCIEQVQRTCQELTNHSFTDLTTVECLARSFAVQTVKLPVVDFGDQTAEEGDSKSPADDETGSDRTAKRTKKGELDSDGDAEETGEGGEEQQMDTASTGGPQSGASRVSSQQKSSTAGGRKFTTGAPPNVMQGHTGFLTFASLY